MESHILIGLDNKNMPYPFQWMQDMKGLKQLRISMFKKPWNYTTLLKRVFVVFFVISTSLHDLQIVTFNYYLHLIRNLKIFINRVALYSCIQMFSYSHHRHKCFDVVLGKNDCISCVLNRKKSNWWPWWQYVDFWLQMYLLFF